MILMDEPSMGLSPLLVKEVFAIIQQINRDLGVTILLVEQNARAALSVASHGYIMEQGKVVLDGSIAATSDNLLVYATSNRRHLMPEFMQENLEYRNVGDEIHPGETSEEKVSLSDRFGLWLGFHPLTQDTFFEILEGYCKHFGLTISTEQLHREAIEWSMTRGSRSGRVAWQFIQDLAGRLGKKLN